MNEHFAVKKCCLICDHAVIGSIDETNKSIPCLRRENEWYICKELDDICEHFVLNSILVLGDNGIKDKKQEYMEIGDE